MNESPLTVGEEMETVITYFDSDGDLKLLVGAENELEIFVVSSKVMSLVCKPWKAMVGLDSKFIEESSCADAAITLPQDDATVLRILLNAAHLRFSLVPDILSFEDLVQLAILCDKYDAAEVVRPWLKVWLIYAQNLSATVGHEGWLWISWTFGLVEKFKKVAGLMVGDLCVDSEHKFTRYDRRLEEHDMPPEIFESILTIRLETIDRLLKAYHFWFQLYVDPPRPRCHAIYSFSNYGLTSNCDALIFASISRAFFSSGFWPGGTPSTSVSLSVGRLALKFVDIKFLTSPEEKSFGQRGMAHDDCNIFNAYKTSFADIVAKVPDPTLQSHTNHIAAQYSKCQVTLVC